MPRGREDRGLFPPEERLNVVTIATSHPEDYDCHATRWSLDDIAATIIKQAHYRDMDRSTVWRVLNEADLKPHRSVYWLNSHDPDFDAKAREICQLYVEAPQLYQQGNLVICCDEKTGMQILRRALEAPTRQIAENSAVDGGVVIARMLGGQGDQGFDAARKEYVDLVDAGIIDPTKVVRIALENAVSVASVLLLTEVTMTEIPETKREQALPPDMGM